MKRDSAACGCGNANQFRGDICTAFPSVSVLDLFMQLKRQGGLLTYRYSSMLHTHNCVSLFCISLLFFCYCKKSTCYILYRQSKARFFITIRFHDYNNAAARLIRVRYTDE